MGAQYPAGISAQDYPSAIDVQDRTATQAMPTTPTVLKLPTVAVQQGNISYDPATGIITFSATKLWNLALTINATTTASRSIYAYAEISLNGGTTWTISRYSGRYVGVNGATSGQVLVSVSDNVFAAGTMLRFYVWASGTVTLTTADLPGTTAGTVTVPAARILMGA